MASVSTDPVSAVASSLKGIMDDVVALSAQTHPRMYHYKIYRLENKLVKECKKFPATTANPNDAVLAATGDLEPYERWFILNTVREELGLQPAPFNVIPPPPAAATK